MIDIGDIATIYTGDCRSVLAQLAPGSVQCCVTSPPYFGLRDYGVDGQIGLEQTPDAYVAELVNVFREVRRVLADDGTLWLNLGDSYASSGAVDVRADRTTGNGGAIPRSEKRTAPTPTGLKPKDLIGIPWRVAFALQADGWYLRQDIIWAKPNPMPESVTDRCTKAHEYLFLLSKSERYWYDAEAIKEPASYDPEKTKFPDGWDTGPGGHGSFHRNGREKGRASGNKTHKSVAAYGNGSDEHRTKAGLLKISETAYASRNKRSVWTIATEAFPDAHFATFPTKLVEPCILAGSREGDTVLDPFGGSGTVPMVAVRNDRRAVMIELNPAYVEMARPRIEHASGQSPDQLFSILGAAP